MENPKKSRNDRACFPNMAPWTEWDKFFPFVESFPLSTQLVPLIHKIRWNILGERGGISVISFVDVGTDVLDDLVGLRVGFALLLHPVDGVEDGGVIPVVELLADVLQGELVMCG